MQRSCKRLHPVRTSTSPTSATHRDAFPPCKHSCLLFHIPFISFCLPDSFPSFISCVHRQATSLYRLGVLYVSISSPLSHLLHLPHPNRTSADIIPLRRCANLPRYEPRSYCRRSRQSRRRDVCRRCQQLRGPDQLEDDGRLLAPLPLYRGRRNS